MSLSKFDLALQVTGAFNQTELKVKSATDFVLSLKPNESLSADRILNLITGNSDRTITLLGNPTLNDWFDQSVKVAASPTFAALKILGSSTGFTTFSSANAGASNYTLTVPAVTDTLAVLGAAQTWLKTQSSNPVLLVSASNATPVDASLSNFFKQTLTEDTTIGAPSNLVEGTVYTFTFTQHASSAKTLDFNVAFVWPTDTVAPVISTDLDSVLIVVASYVNSILRCNSTLYPS